jgi:glycosyltransferase involved in cell wall biosynthesis
MELRESGVRVVAVPQGAAERRQNILRALPGPLPLRAAAPCGAGLIEAVYREARSGGYDVAHVDGIAASALGYALIGIPTVLDAASCVSLALTRRSRDGWRVGARVAPELARTRRHEATYLGSYERVVAASAEDAWALRMLGQRSGAQPPAVHIVPTPVETDDAAGLLTFREQGTLLLCAGPEGRAATLQRVASEVMPRIWSQRADIRLLIVGPTPARLARGGAADPRILSVSAQDQRAIARATLALAPGDAQAADAALQVMGMGTPLIASRMIGRILQAADGRDLLLADSAEELARAALELLDDPRYRGQIGRAGRTHIERHHSPAVVADELERVYAAACGAAIADWGLDVGLGRLLNREVGGSQ